MLYNDHDDECVCYSCIFVIYIYLVECCIVCHIMKTTVGNFSCWPSFHTSQRPLRGRHRDNENDWILVQCNINTRLFRNFAHCSLNSWINDEFLRYGSFKLKTKLKFEQSITKSEVSSVIIKLFCTWKYIIIFPMC